MSLKLPKPDGAYSQNNEAQARAAMENEDRNNRKRSSDVEVGGARLILTSPNGTRWNVTVSNAGALVVTAL